jgi:aspartate aminotransferase-like enzyme
MYKKLLIPGPTHVRDEILREMATPMIGHRAKEYADLQAEVTRKVQRLLYTKNVVFLFTSASSGVMEGAIRNCVRDDKKVLCTINGAFGARWHDMIVSNGKEFDVVEVEWGKAITPELIDAKLSSGKYDAMTLTHNETSTGVMNPIYEIAEVMKKYPDVCWLVDAVSSIGGVKIEVDKLGIDVCIAGVQKALALPPGLTLCSVSQKAFDRAKEIKNRGWYFDFLLMLKYYQRNQTPATPAISHIFALNKQMDDIFAEGLDARFQRHIEMAEFIRDWARKHFALYADERYLSNTLTTIRNTRGISVADLNKALAERGAMISNGYGRLKDQTFRIAHMGDLTMDDIHWITGLIEDILGL